MQFYVNNPSSGPLRGPLEELFGFQTPGSTQSPNPGYATDPDNDEELMEIIMIPQIFLR